MAKGKTAIQDVPHLLVDTKISLEVSRDRLEDLKRVPEVRGLADKAEGYVQEALNVLNEQIVPAATPTPIDRVRQWLRQASPNHRHQFIRLASTLPKGDPDRRTLLRMAMEFDTEDALKKYLDEHPNADKSLHKVKEHDKEKGHGEEEEDEEPDFGNLESKFNKFLGKIKGIGASTLESLKKAPKKVQAFVADPEERKKVLSTASDKIKDAPAALAKNALHAIQDLGHEYQTAGKAVGKIYRKEPLTKHDKKAMFAIGLTAAAVVLAGATGGTAMAAGTFGKAVGKHVAAAAIHATMKELNVLGEAGEVAFHLGEGALHMMGGGAPGGHHAAAKGGDKKEPTEEEAMSGFVNLVVAKTHSTLKKGVDDKMLEKVLKEEDPEDGEFEDDDDEKGKKAALIRLASQLPKGSDERRSLLRMAARSREDAIRDDARAQLDVV